MSKEDAFEYACELSMVYDHIVCVVTNLDGDFLVLFDCFVGECYENRIVASYCGGEFIL